MGEKILLERRAEARWKVNDEFYVIVDARPQMMGQLLEISSKGLAFKFFDMDAISNDLEDRANLTINIFHGGHGYLAEQIHCRLISRTNREIGNTFCLTPVKRIGLQFVHLTAPQQERVKVLLDTHPSLENRRSAV
jgi:hypothetical protein